MTIFDGREKRIVKVFNDEDERVTERQEKINAAQSLMDTIVAPDNRMGDKFSHSYTDDAAAKKKNFDEKVYLFPPSFNALRRELEDNWNHLFTTINPETGVSLAHAMVYDAPQFIGICNGVLDMAEQLDTGNVEGICKAFLNGFRAKRGVSRLE